MQRSLLVCLWCFFGCQTPTNEDTQPSDELTVYEEAAPKTKTAPPPKATSKEDEPDDGKRFALGPLTDSDVQQVIYRGLETKLSQSQTHADGTEETTDIGRAKDFKYTIIKLTRGGDDVSGSPNERADGMDVEVTGWYRRTTRGDTETKAACTSFDAFVTLTKKQGDWSLADKPGPTFAHEDPEDCY